MFETILLELTAFVGALHLLAPLLVRSTMRFSGVCQLSKVPVDGLPDEAATTFRQRIPELVELGFEFLGCYDCGSLSSETHSYMAYFCNRRTNDFASVSMLVTPRRTTSYLEFSTSFTNGLILETNTNDSLPLTPAQPENRIFRFPNVRPGGELYRIHRRLIEKHAAGLWAKAEAGGDELLRYKSVIENYGPRHTRIGYMELAEDGTSYQLTWRGACLVAWRGLWPTSIVRRLQQRHLMQSELDSLELRGVAALQKA
jgi:hypothetical protein